MCRDGQPMSRSIVYCYAKSGSANIEPGYWFFDYGQAVQCAHILRDTDCWYLYIETEIWNKPLPTMPIKLDSMERCVEAVAEYFNRDVIEVAPEDFPGPDY